jgi:hypothetical protein
MVSHCRELRIREGQLAYMPRASVALRVVSQASGARPSKCFLFFGQWTSAEAFTLSKGVCGDDPSTLQDINRSSSERISSDSCSDGASYRPRHSMGACVGSCRPRQPMGAYVGSCRPRHPMGACVSIRPSRVSCMFQREGWIGGGPGGAGTGSGVSAPRDGQSQC